MIAVADPVQAHFTLGDLTPTYRYHANDFDPHVPGVIGYVWPGGGADTWDGFPNYANVNNAPGYQSPYPGGKPSNVPGLNQVGNAPSSSWYQLESDAYAPFGAVLAGSTGDLIFAVNATACAVQGQEPDVHGNCIGGNFSGNWAAIDILLPPGFTMPMDGSNIVTTISNAYNGYGVYVLQLSQFDRYAPGWTAVQIMTDSAIIKNPNTGLVQNHEFLNFTKAGEWYYIRMNHVTAPSVAGRYFFKILLTGTSNKIAGEEGTATGFVATQPANYGAAATTIVLGGLVFTESPTQFIPTENWPVLLVKGEIDPAIITGTIRYAGYNQTLYSNPIQEAGKVEAVMTTRLDPYTGQARSDLPLVNAVGYFNATAQGHYEVEGVAPGVYDLYASAAGYPKTLIQSGLTVLKGQSLHFDGYLQPGPVIHGNVFTKHQFGDEPWPLNTGNPGDTTNPNNYIKIELYDTPTLNHIPDLSSDMVSWSPLPCVAGGQDHFNPNGHAAACDDPRLGSNIGFPWHEYTPANGYGYPSGGASALYYQVSVSGQAPFYGSNLLMQDPQGVGPPQHWYTLGGTTTPFHYEFGVKGEYGAPRDLDGMVPQVYATWVNGLTPGRYYARAWVFRYVQSALDGSTFQEYYFDVTPNEWAGDVTLPIDLRLSSWVNKTVHFHNTINGIMEDPINTGAGYLTGYLKGSDGQVYSYNQTKLGVSDRRLCTSGPYCYVIGPKIGHWPNAGQLGAGDGTTSTMHSGDVCSSLTNGGVCPGINSGIDLDKAKLNRNALQEGRANIQFYGFNDTWSGENYGIPSGTYTPHVFALGYLEQTPVEDVSVTLSGNPTSISDHMYRGVGFNVTLYGIDWQRPTVNRPWEFGNPKGLDGNGDHVGAEIDLAWFKNNSFVEWTGDVNQPLRSWASTVPTTGLFQGETFDSALSESEGNVPPSSDLYTQMIGGGINVWDTRGNLQTALDVYFGSEITTAGYVGGYMAGFGPANFPFYGWSHVRPLLGDYESLRPPYLFILPTGQEASAFDEGQYDLRGYTYGYVQTDNYGVYAQRGQIADMRINLVQGVNITVDVLFKKEHIITPTSADMSGRIRVFNDQGQLVAEWMTSMGTYVTGNGLARASDGTNGFPFGPMGAPNVGVCTILPKPCFLVPDSGDPYFNFIQGGTTLLHAEIAGLPDVPAEGMQAPFLVPWGNYPGDPVFTHQSNFCTFGPQCVAKEFPNVGILGAPNYQGGWTVEVDFVNWYSNQTSPPQDPLGLLGGHSPTYYPPVDGLLMGESYHIIPGTTATSGISLTEDAALVAPPVSLGYSMAFNHLGPYSQEGVWQISNAHLSGEASGEFEIDLNGLVTGNAYAFTWTNEFRPLSWGLVTVTGAPGTAGSPMNFYTYDGMYEAYLTPGTYQFTISSPGLTSQTYSIAVSSGQTSTGYNMYLQQNNIPVPEFSGLIIAAISALASSLYVLRRRRDE
jgi:hypothetical protein